MKHLFDPAVVAEVEGRILALSVRSERQWGSMSVAQMLAHCRSAMAMATGELPVRSAPLAARVVGRLIKPLVFRDDAPLRRNSPSAPELFRGDAERCDFGEERDRLLPAVRNLRPEVCTSRPHPFFGPLRPEQWAILMYKHLDHHLRQFGA